MLSNTNSKQFRVDGVGGLSVSQSPVGQALNQSGHNGYQLDRERGGESGKGTREKLRGLSTNARRLHFAFVLQCGAFNKMAASSCKAVSFCCLSPVGSCLRIGNASLVGVGSGGREATSNGVLAAQYKTDKHKRGYHEVKVEMMK